MKGVLMAQPEAHLLTSTTSDLEVDSSLVDALATLGNPSLALGKDSDWRPVVIWG